MSLGESQVYLLGGAMTRDGGKGDSPRPLGIPMDKFDEAWDRIFNKKEAFDKPEDNKGKEDEQD